MITLERGHPNYEEFQKQIVTANGTRGDLHKSLLKTLTEQEAAAESGVSILSPAVLQRFQSAYDWRTTVIDLSREFVNDFNWPPSTDAEAIAEEHGGSTRLALNIEPVKWRDLAKEERHRHKPGGADEITRWHNEHRISFGKFSEDLLISKYPLREWSDVSLIKIHSKPQLAIMPYPEEDHKDDPKEDQS